MTIMERKKMLLGAIRKLETRLVCLKYCEYDGVKDKQERDTEIELIQKHLHCAHSALVIVTEEEVA